LGIDDCNSIGVVQAPIAERSIDDHGAVYGGDRQSVDATRGRYDGVPASVKHFQFITQIQ